MNTTENQNDFSLESARHASLAATFPNGKCQCEQCKPFNNAFPADKWAAEKAAYAQGKKIECRFRPQLDAEWTLWEEVSKPTWNTHEAVQYRIAPDPAPTYHTPAVVQQRREEAAAINAAINAAMNPAPAGKLTDEQLGEVGAKAAVSHHGVFVIAVEPSEACYVVDTRLRTTFARAVREAVEKEQAEEITSLLQDKADAIAMAQAAERETTREQDMRLKDREEIARLTAELDKKARQFEECTDLLQATDEKRHAAQAELAKANAELERLRWRSVEVKPTREDADPEGYVLVCGVDSKCRGIHDIRHPFGSHDSHWMPFPSPPPAPTAEEVERERFERMITECVPGGQVCDPQEIADNLRAWQARAAKEGEK